MSTDTLDRDPQSGWPEKLVALIDALHGFIDIDMAMGRMMLAEGKITSAEFHQGMVEIRALQRLVKRLEMLNRDAPLDGTVGT